ncbi:helix-turn-helix domain-containing protein [Mycobacterium avium]|uniref:helix-turn-helix domain-containing protein n=1 Tax=Mycobacterium avium TaxID=1764 RepID=UPI00079FEF12|nr:helix-turn-helix transcriptional regulator [Mycobacterium avium]
MATPRLVELIDRYKNAHGASEAELARRIGVSRENLRKWRTNGVSRLPDRTNLAAVARVIGRPYREVLSAALFDTGYLTDNQAAIPRPYDEVLHDAISVLTEASRLTNQPMRQMSSGQWEADPDPRAALRIDWAAFVTEALAGAAANAGGIDTILAGRPGSWEASVVGDVLRAAVGHDEWDLLRHRTEPVTVVLNPERILFDHGGSNDFEEMEAAEGEITRREKAIRPGRVYSGDAEPQRLQWAIDLGYEVRAGHSPPLPTREELDATMAVADPTSLSPVEQAEEDALEALSALRDRLAQQYRADLAAYGERLAHAVRTKLAALQLPVPITVTVDLDTPWDQAPQTPTVGWTTGAIDTAIADAIAATPTPDSGPGTTLLERAEESLRRDRAERASE